MSKTFRNSPYQRRGNVLAAVAVSGTVLFGFAALAIDMGMLYRTRAEAQRSADAGALAGAWNLIGEQRLAGATGAATVADKARQAASGFAGANLVFDGLPQVGANDDVVLGRLSDPRNLAEQLQTGVSASQTNAVKVTVRRDETRNGAVPLFFAQIFGFTQKSLNASAVAAVEDRIAGFRVSKRTGKTGLLPFAVHVDVWNRLMSGAATAGDSYAYDAQTKTVSTGGDGVHELNMYPGSGNGGGNNQLPPGNFGTVDIGNPNNSTADISRQIREGANAEDLAYFGGELRLDSDGTLILQGDTGLSAGIKDDLQSIIGQPRTIPLFIKVTGNGNNSRFTVVGFAGIRVLNVKLTGSMNSKAVIIQPAIVVDDGAIAEDIDSYSYFVFRPPALVR